MNTSETISRNISPRPTVEQIDRELERLGIIREMKKAVTGTIKNLIIIAAVTVLITNVLISVLTVNRSSMTPTLQDGDVVIAWKLFSAKAGDIVAFHYNNKILLKRVIAEAGDMVYIDEDGNVYVNDKMLEEPYLTEKSLTDCNIELPYHVPDGTIFVMGDHRTASADSRLKEIGPIREEDVAGKIVLRLWPLTRLSFFG